MGIIVGLYWVFMGITEKKMETMQGQRKKGSGSTGINRYQRHPLLIDPLAADPP